MDGESFYNELRKCTNQLIPTNPEWIRVISHENISIMLINRGSLSRSLLFKLLLKLHKPPLAKVHVALSRKLLIMPKIILAVIVVGTIFRYKLSHTKPLNAQLKHFQKFPCESSPL